jgi:glycerol-3-phosphate dehydrogenase subunit C
VTELVRDSLDHCVKCTICESFCPYAEATPLFPGPKYVGPQAERFRTGGRSPDYSVDYCSGCGICTQVCPQGVKIAEINSKARAQMWEERGIPLRNQVIARPSVVGRLGTPVAPLANWTLRNRPFRWAFERALGVHRKAALPRFAGRTFPPQDCCGLPLQSNGNFPAARSYVRRLAANLAPYAREGLPIVANSTSCGLMLKREALEILEVDDEDVVDVSGAMYDLCEFLLGLHERGELRTDFEPLELTVPYHAPCQQQGQGIGKPALDLFALVPGLRAIELGARCCGIAGTYGFKKEKYEIGMTVGEEVFAPIRESNADVAACDSETCRWQIEHGSGVHAVHPVEILHRAYGLAAA